MQSSFIDLNLPLDGSGGEAMQARSVYVTAMDLLSSEDFLELVKIALLAALEALGSGSLFGLITFIHKIGIYDVQGSIPVIKNIFIHPDSEGELPVDLEDMMPLFSFLAHVEDCKDQIVVALETLKPITSYGRNTISGQEHDGVFIGGRGFGVAIDALINYY